MKKQLLYFIAFFVIATLSSMKPDDADNFVEFDDNLYVSKFEITNGEYNLFLKEMKKTYGPEKIEKFLPDSAMWTGRFDFSYNEPYTNLYHWHPSYDNYPVVNISKEAMEAYCTWKTESYNSKEKRTYKKVVFRLPTEKEWMRFSSPLPGHQLPWYGNFPYVLDEKSKEVCMVTNIKVIDYVSGTYDYVYDGASITSPVGSYPPNSIEIFDIIGNVAEFTSDDKIKGGSWYNKLSECLIDISQDYDLPDPRVGFRVVMEIIEK